MSVEIGEELLESNYWNTKKVNELLYKAEEEGLDFKSVDNPFHDSDPSLKRANILYEYTREEILEIEKCSKDAVYFSKYCQVMTDDGLQYIKLRDYQVSVVREYQANRFNVFLAPCIKAYSLPSMSTFKYSGCGNLYSFIRLSKVFIFTCSILSPTILKEAQ